MPVVVYWVIASLIGLLAFISLTRRAYGRWLEEKVRPEWHPVRYLAYSRLRAKCIWTVTMLLCLAVGAAAFLATANTTDSFVVPPGISIAVICVLLGTAVLVDGILDEWDDRKFPAPINGNGKAKGK